MPKFCLDAQMKRCVNEWKLNFSLQLFQLFLYRSYAYFVFLLIVSAAGRLENYPKPKMSFDQYINLAT